MKAYKKRARAGYCSGKGYKKESNASERMHEREEIKDELNQIAQGEGFRYKHKKKAKKRTELERIECQITRDDKHLRIMLGWRNGNKWFGDHIVAVRNRIRHYKTKVIEIIQNKKDSENND